MCVQKLKDTMKKLKVSSSQFNYKYGDQIHFPYSIATLVAWIKSIPDLANRFEFEKSFVFRNKLKEYASLCYDSDILLCSCYTWNWEVTKKLAENVKKNNPNCLIIFGGPQVPKWYGEYNDKSFFDEYNYVDIIVHGEGEQVIENIFRAFINGGSFKGIAGIETRGYKGLPQPRFNDIAELPSPYLTNIVWDLVSPEKDIKYIAAWESNRGCPFSCTFCDWGSATNGKVRKRDQNRLEDEIEWFGQNNIPYVDVCDANWGIFKGRDLELSKKFTEVKKQYGYPEKIRPAWAKVSSDKLIPVAKILLEADMLRAVTLAVQSLDETTLNTIKRKNIKFKKWGDLVNKFRSANIENYTELILALPGETLESFKNSLEQMMELFPRPVIYIYNCGVFPNAPMNEPSYKKEYNIKTIRSPIFLMHSTKQETKIPEYEDIVVSNSTITSPELHEAYLYSWLVQAFHSFGILEYVSRIFREQHNMKYVDFYSELVNFCEEHQNNIFSKEYKFVKKYIQNGYSGGGWEHHDPKLGDICWPPEEATFLRCVWDSSLLEKNIFEFIEWLVIKKKLNVDIDTVKDLAKFQTYVLTSRDRQEDVKVESFLYDWKKYFCTNSKILHKTEVVYEYLNKVVEKKDKDWCYKTAWWGRGPKKYKTDPTDLKYFL
mgnify:CR=1 FL=1|tara:strand:+ start:765 stop:2738 length:1974 start_codon:yes stop_codon:yes gene_type:complete